MPHPATVLVLEGHPCQLLHSISFVEDAGFAVLAADGVERATSLLEEYSEIEATFVSLDAPGSDALLSDLRRRWPNIRIVLTATCLPATSTRIPKGATFFPKPFGPHDVEAALAQRAA